MKLDEVKDVVDRVFDDSEWHVSPDKLPDDLLCVEEGNYTSDGKYEFCQSIYKDSDGNYFAVSQARSGSYHTDYNYCPPEVYEVVPKEILTIVYEAK
jgi:hypothetical protein